MYIDSAALDVVISSQSQATLGSIGAVAYSDQDPFDWHVFCVKPGLADVAHNELRKQSFKTFRPKLVTKVTVDKKHEVVSTVLDLFGHYHFVKFRTDDGGWSRVHHTFGVRRLILSTSLRPATMPAAAMAKLLAHPMTYDDGVKKDPSLVGETIRVLDGPFTSFVGIVEASAAGRVDVLLGMFGRPCNTNLPITSVERVA